MRIYISGPMTGFPNQNREAFSAAAAKLRSQGHFAINPHDLTNILGTPEEIEKSFQAFYCYLRSENLTSLALNVMSADIAAVRSCEAIYLLRGWEDSRGARKELAVAIKYKLKILQEGAQQ